MRDLVAVVRAHAEMHAEKSGSYSAVSISSRAPLTEISLIAWAAMRANQRKYNRITWNRHAKYYPARKSRSSCRAERPI
jgi:hypothetical protein